MYDSNHFSASSFLFSHWPPHGLNHISDINLQLSLSTEWWLRYAEYHCLLFIDFKLKWVMDTACKCACAHTCVLEQKMIYSKSRSCMCAWRGLLKSNISAMLTSQRRRRQTDLAVWTHTQWIKTHFQFKNRPYRNTQKLLIRLQLCNRFFHLVQRKGKPQNCDTLLVFSPGDYNLTCWPND